MDVKIYVEGVNDRVFLADFIAIVFGVDVIQSGEKKNKAFKFADGKGEILILGTGKGGWSKLRTSPVQDDFRANIEEGIKTLVIIDADTTLNQGSF